MVNRSALLTATLMLVQCTRNDGTMGAKGGGDPFCRCCLRPPSLRARVMRVHHPC